MKQPSVYLTAKMPLPQYLPYARFLLNAELTHKAKLLYTLLLDRATLSQKNNWVDTVGRVYVLYPIAHLTRFALQPFKHYTRVHRIGEPGLWNVCTVDFQNQAVFCSRFRKCAEVPFHVMHRCVIWRRKSDQHGCAKLHT